MFKRFIFIITGIFIYCSAVGQTVNSTHLVLYSGYGLVNQDLNFPLKKGENQFNLSILPGQIDEGSLLFFPEGKGGEVNFSQTEYLPGSISITDFLQEKTGENIQVFLKNSPSLGGKLLRLQGGTILLKQRDDAVEYIPVSEVSRISLPDRDTDFNTKAHYKVTAYSSRSGEFPVKMAYMTPLFGWNAQYTAIYSEKAGTLLLNTKVNIVNRADVGFKNAGLTLVSGEPRKPAAPVPRTRNMMFAAKEAAADAGGGGFTQEKQFEYHIFQYDKPVSLVKGQKLELALYPHKKISVKRALKYNGQQNGEDVMVLLDFANEKSSGIGMPLPAGGIKVYQQRNDGNLMFLGESFISHTPVKKKVSLYVGNAFDLTGKRKLEDFKQIDKYTRDETYSIELLNGGDKKQTVLIEEYARGGWGIRSSSMPYVKKDAQHFEFTVDVPAESSKKIGYTIRFKTR